MNFWDPNTSSKLIIFITNGSKFKGTPDTCLISKDLGHPYFERLPNTINIYISHQIRFQCEDNFGDPQALFTDLIAAFRAQFMFKY